MKELEIALLELNIKKNNDQRRYFLDLIKLGTPVADVLALAKLE